jgi:hypothetical protein
MRFGKVLVLLGVSLLVWQAVPASAGRAGRGPTILLADMDGGDGGAGPNIDLAVRQVKVQPVRAHVGDVVNIEVLIENKFEGSRTTPAEVYANGKRIGYQLFTWGRGGDRLHHLYFAWNTAGLRPGEYKIAATAFVFEDTSGEDNELDVQQPVILAAPGSGFPGGQLAGGEYTETDPRFGKNTIRND